jgi:hypothetical protein
MTVSRVLLSMRNATRVLSCLAVVAVLSLLFPAALANPVAAMPAPSTIHKTNSTIGSGYEAGMPVNGSVTAVAASWIQPKVVCTSLNATALFEAFLGGFTHLQIGGTAVSCKGGVPSAYAWYSFSTSGMTKISTATVPVHAGAVVQVSIKNVAGTATIVIKVGNHSVTKTHAGSGLDNIAGNGVARNVVLGVPQPLAKFGNVSFGKLFTKVAGTTDATVNGTTAGIGTFHYVFQFTMVNSHGTKLAVPTPVASSGTSFKVAWLGYS